MANQSRHSQLVHTLGGCLWIPKLLPFLPLLLRPPEWGWDLAFFVIHNCFQVPLALLVSQDNKVCPIL